MAKSGTPKNKDSNSNANKMNGENKRSEEVRNSILQYSSGKNMMHEETTELMMRSDIKDFNEEVKYVDEDS